MNDGNVISKTRDAFFGGKPAIYIIVLLVACVAAYVYKFRTENIFACPGGSGYTSDRYLSYCEAANYGDYEHGAFWFKLEPAAVKSAVAAEVLFLGDSRLQFAFSTVATESWFSSNAISYYLLGFVGFENSQFARALLHKLRPNARVYVIAIGDFFESAERPIAVPVLHDGASQTRYEIKGVLQLIHKAMCTKLAKVCGHSLVIYRSRQSGMWYMPETTKFRGLERPVSYDEQVEEHSVHDAVAIGQTFLSELPVNRDCVILTVVPTVGTKIRMAEAISKGLDKTLVVPEHVDALSTREGVHLDQISAEHWSEAFFKAAGSAIRKCLDTRGHATDRPKPLS